jgi:hypothetical protein
MANREQTVYFCPAHDLRNRNVETTKKGRGTGGYGSDRCSTVRRHGAGSSPSQRVG